MGHKINQKRIKRKKGKIGAGIAFGGDVDVVAAVKIGPDPNPTWFAGGNLGAQIARIRRNEAGGKGGNGKKK